MLNARHCALYLRYVEKFEEQDIRGDVLLDLTPEELECVLRLTSQRSPFVGHT